MKYYLSYIKNILFVIYLSICLSVIAGDIFVIEMKLENHVFTPSEIKVPAGVKIKLVIDNRDSSIEEFDSPSLKREKILRSKAKTNIILAPLKSGRYEFIGEFHPETAKGALVVE